MQVNGDVADSDDCSQELDEIDDNLGFTLDEMYRFALIFYKEKEGKAVHLSYKDKLRLVSLTKQVSFGEYHPGVSPDVGLLDVVGNDRRLAWQALSDMSREEAMREFVHELADLTPLFRAVIEAHYAERKELERKQLEAEELTRRVAEEEAARLAEEEAARQAELERVRQLQHEEAEAARLAEEQRLQQMSLEMQIRAALNQQTVTQFREYAEQQFPHSREQQDELIGQLQEQHFQQYMQQIYEQQQLQLEHNSNMASSDETDAPVLPNADDAAEEESEALYHEEDGEVLYHESPQHHVENERLPNGDVQHAEEEDDEEEGAEESNEHVPIGAASMWTRKDIKEFKNSLRTDVDSVIKVGSGETVTVRVPTHEDGTCLFWEFATDSYDLGFGVYFEWTIAPNNQVSVHVSESSDEEELLDDGGGGSAEDPEKGELERRAGRNEPPSDEIIPVYRRDCHEEVYCGSHMYPGRGVYLLKFDNSYSLWRSKTLYYRVYYTR